MRAVGVSVITNSMVSCFLILCVLSADQWLNVSSGGQCMGMVVVRPAHDRDSMVDLDVYLKLVGKKNMIGDFKVYS